MDEQPRPQTDALMAKEEGRRTALWKKAGFRHSERVTKKIRHAGGAHCKAPLFGETNKTVTSIKREEKTQEDKLSDPVGCVAAPLKAGQKQDFFLGGKWGILCSRILRGSPCKTEMSKCVDIKE